MSSLSSIIIFRIEKLEKHPNADALDITEAFGCPVICKRGSYKEGDLAAFVPVDMIAPETAEFEFLGSSKRIKAKKLRGIFSMGLLVKAPQGTNIGDDITDLLGFKKYEPELTISIGGGNSTPSPRGGDIKYTDIESLRRYKDVLNSEQVVVTEKLHGANARFCYQNEELIIGSHHRWIFPDEHSEWNKIAVKLDLKEKLKRFSNHIFFGELYGVVQKGFPYGLKSPNLMFFDIFNIDTGKYLDWNNVVDICQSIELKVVPILYQGEYQGFEQIKRFAEGPSTLDETHIREGFVIRTTTEKWNKMIGRTILKLHGEGYLLGNKIHKEKKKAEPNERKISRAAA